MYEAAVDVVVREGRGSVSLLQRALGIGYGRAARLVDFMAEDGIVGHYNGSQAREVLLTVEQWEEMSGAKGADAPAKPAASSAPPTRSNRVLLSPSEAEGSDFHRSAADADEDDVDEDGIDADDGAIESDFRDEAPFDEDDEVDDEDASDDEEEEDADDVDEEDEDEDEVDDVEDSDDKDVPDDEPHDADPSPNKYPAKHYRAESGVSCGHRQSTPLPDGSLRHVANPCVDTRGGESYPCLVIRILDSSLPCPAIRPTSAAR